MLEKVNLEERERERERENSNRRVGDKKVQA
jgi:hypothetical protein